MLNIEESTDKIINKEYNNSDEESQGLYEDCVHSYKDEFNNICIDCDLPGRDENNIHIYWNSRKDLTIIADECAAGKYYYYPRKSVHVVFHFENNIDYDNSTAIYNNGVLTVSTKPLSENNKNV